MKSSLLPLLACPDCHGALDLGAEESKDGEIDSGRLECRDCARATPITGGVPRFATTPRRASAGSTVKRFGYQWKEFREKLDEYRASFLDWMKPFTEKDFADKIVLDAGCGMGRFSEVAASFGARTVIGVDLSESVEVAHEAALERENLHIVQADLLNLPFGNPFDLVYCIGVLHHLPDGEEGFLALTRHVRPQGHIHAWVYGQEGNEWLLRLGNPIREKITSRLPPPLLRAVAWSVAVPLHGALVLGYRSTDKPNPKLPYASYLGWLAGFPFRHTHQVVFDHMAAPIAHYYRREEFAQWFARAGLKDVCITSRNANSWRGSARAPAGVGGPSS